MKGFLENSFKSKEKQWTYYAEHRQLQDKFPATLS